MKIMNFMERRPPGLSYLGLFQVLEGFGRPFPEASSAHHHSQLLLYPSCMSPMWPSTVCKPSHFPCLVTCITCTHFPQQHMQLSVLGVPPSTLSVPGVPPLCSTLMTLGGWEHGYRQMAREVSGFRSAAVGPTISLRPWRQPHLKVCLCQPYLS